MSGTPLPGRTKALLAAVVVGGLGICLGMALGPGGTDTIDGPTSLVVCCAGLGSLLMAVGLILRPHP